MQLNFHTEFTLHQRVYLKVRTLDVKEAGLKATGWVWATLRMFADASAHTGLQQSQVNLVLATVREVALDVSWQEWAGVPPARLTLETAISTIEALEEAVDQLGIPEHRKAQKATQVRLWLQRGLTELGVPRAERLPAQYRPRLVMKRPPPRSMISDLRASEGAQEGEYPLAALPHDSVRELVTAERQKRELDLARVEQAALREIEEHERKFQLMRSHFEGYPANCKQQVEREMGLMREQIPSWMRGVGPRDLAASYFQLFNDQSFWKQRAGGMSVKVSGATLIADYLDGALGVQTPRNRIVETFVYPMAMQHVLCACLLLIQAHTGWNVNSVLEMRRNMVEGTRSRYNIQGYKRRITQLTPIVEVSNANAGALKALQFVLDRHTWMVDRGWISADETRLWLNPSSIKTDEEPSQYVGWGSCLTDFCTKYSLPHFSFEQMRVQKLSLISLSAAGVRGAQEAAGHLQVGTTGHYLEQDILIRIRSAMNLEFQRRLESAITYELEGSGNAKHRYLLRDIGDGASCSAPDAPPWGEDLLNDECRAQHCHSGPDGCPNRVIKITEQSLEAAVRMSRFYRKNWSRIAMDNPAAFERLHMDRLVFNQAVLHAVSRSPYRAKLKSVEERVALEES